MKEIRFPVTIDDSQAAKDLQRLQQKILKLRDAVDKASQTKLDLGAQLKEAEANAEATAAKVKELKEQLATYDAALASGKKLDASTWVELKNQQAQIKEELQQQEPILADQQNKAATLKAKYNDVVTTLERQTSELKAAEREAGQLEKQVSLQQKAAQMQETVRNATDSLKTGIKNIAKWGAGITGLVVLARRLRTYIIEAVKSFAENDPETKANIDSLKASLAGLKASWGAAFAPVLNAVVPILQTLISWLATAANAVAQFFAIISGKSTYKKAIANTNELASGLGGVADNAKEAKKQLMGIDTLNIMNDSNTSSGGGGGGDSNAFDWVDEAVNADSFSGKLALSFKDVFLDWDNLNGEQIAEKIIAGLAGLAGAVIGFSIGGVPGAVVGTLAGITIGLVADSLIFDHDGQLSGHEVAQSLIVVLGALAGGVIGFSIGGGAVGAAIGATVGVGVTLALRNVTVETAATWQEMNILEKVCTVLGGLAGGLIGFFVGAGPLGAVIGAAIGVGLMLTIKSVSVDNQVNSGGKDWIYYILHDKIGLPSDQEIIKWLWDDGILAAIRDIKPMFASTLAGLNEIQTWYETNVRPWFTVSKWKALGQTAMDSLISAIKTKWQELKAFWANLRLPQFHIPRPVFSWSGQFSLFPLQVPHLSLTWMAKGGIVDGATLIGAGEAGKEAIIPLERNTQWIRNVATELSDMLFDRDIFTEIADRIAPIPTALDRMTAQIASLGNISMPAVAMGTVVPPNSAGGSYGGISPELESKISSLLDLFSKQDNRPINIHTTVELDRRKVGDSMYSYIRDKKRANGT